MTLKLIKLNEIEREPSGPGAAGQRSVMAKSLKRNISGHPMLKIRLSR
jgi:hypothetical protein